MVPRALRLAPVGLLLLLACAAAGPTPPAPATPRDVRILRDVWGVPHVFGATDPDVAFGLAWVQAEDDFETIQISLMAARGQLARLIGPEGATNDYLVALLRLRESVAEGYARLSPDARALAEAFADGLNRYAARHPQQVAPGVLPFDGEDVALGFVHKHGLFVLSRTLRRVFDEERSVDPPRSDLPTGSNAFAVAPARSSDGRTRLAINSHQPWEGPVAWYEAHVRSDSGWETVGGVFPGSPVILHGHNRQLGWAHTVNFPDLVDVYELEMHPEDPNRYRFDGAWRELEVREVPLRVKLLGPLSWTFRREAAWSVHGPVVRREDGVYALRWGGMGEVRQLEQTYRMNRARSFAEWRAAMEMQALPMFNTVYADAEGRIYYVYNATLPLRAEGYDWSRAVPGDRSDTLWHESLPYEALPQILDPPVGFVQNCNSTPFRTTDSPADPRPEDFPPSLGIETRMTNRALRAVSLLAEDASISHEEFLAIKYDLAYAADSPVAELLETLLERAAADPSLAEETALLRRWDRRTDAANRATALAVLSLKPILDARRAELPEPDLLESLREAAETLRRHHGRLDVPWQEVNRLRRGEVDLGLAGGPDILHAVYGDGPEEGRLVGAAGDSYVLIASWGPEGVRSWSIHQYGSATLDASSPHYADQAVLFARRLLKPVWLDESDIRAHLEREYRPGP